MTLARLIEEVEVVKHGDTWCCPFLMKDGCDQPQGLCYCLRDSRHKPQDAAILRAMEGRE